jgi:hypothetical protein
MENRTNTISIFHLLAANGNWKRWLIILCIQCVYSYIHKCIYIILLYIIFTFVYHFNLKFPPNKNTTRSKFQGHAFESYFRQSCDYEWWIAKSLDSRSSRVFRPKKIGEFHLRAQKYRTRHPQHKKDLFKSVLLFWSLKILEDMRSRAWFQELKEYNESSSSKPVIGTQQRHRTVYIRACTVGE